MSSDSDTSISDCPDGSTSKAPALAVTEVLSRALAADAIKFSCYRNEESKISGDSSNISKHCAICGLQRAIYTCPCCKVRTCSLDCITTHKQERGCSGVRDVAQEIPLSSFTDSDLRRDFYFLENCKRISDNAKRHFTYHCRYSYQALPPPLFLLRDAAKRRGVVCQFISEGLVKRDLNTTRYDRRTDTITWRLELKFIDGPSSFTANTDWANERFLLKEIIAYAWALNPQLQTHFIHRGYNKASRWVESENKKELESNGALASTSAGSNDYLNPDTAQQQLLMKEKISTFLNKYPNYDVLSKAERLLGPVKYFRLNPDDTVHDGMRTLFFVSEFPTLLVIPHSNLPEYLLLTESDKIAFRETFRKRLREPSAPNDDSHGTVPCREFSRTGSCKKTKCKYWHCPPDRLPVCRSMIRDGTCSLGDRCSFRHTTVPVTHANRDTN